MFFSDRKIFYMSLYGPSQLHVYDHCCGASFCAENFLCWPSTPSKANTWFDQSVFILYYKLRHLAGVSLDRFRIAVSSSNFGPEIEKHTTNANDFNDAYRFVIYLLYCFSNTFQEITPCWYEVLFTVIVYLLNLASLLAVIFV